MKIFYSLICQKGKIYMYFWDVFLMLWTLLGLGHDTKRKARDRTLSIGSSRSTLVQSNWRSQENPTPSRPDPRDQEVNGLREQIRLLWREVQEGLNLMERSNKRIRESKEKKKKKAPSFFTKLKNKSISGCLPYLAPHLWQGNRARHASLPRWSKSHHRGLCCSKEGKRWAW